MANGARVSDLPTASICVPNQVFDADAICAVLAEMTPDALRIMLASKRFKVHAFHTHALFAL